METCCIKTVLPDGRAKNREVLCETSTRLESKKTKHRWKSKIENQIQRNEVEVEARWLPLGPGSGALPIGAVVVRGKRLGRHPCQLGQHKGRRRAIRQPVRSCKVLRGIIRGRHPERFWSTPRYYRVSRESRSRGSPGAGRLGYIHTDGWWRGGTNPTP